MESEITELGGDSVSPYRSGQRKIAAYRNLEDATMVTWKMKYLIASFLLVSISGCGKETPHKSIAFLGDSLTEHHDWYGDFPQFDVAVVANGGRQSSGVLANIEQLSTARYDAIYLLIGINDLGHSIPQSTTLQNVREILTRLKASQPAAILYLESVLPLSPRATATVEGQARTAQIESLNAAYRTLANDIPGTRYVDVYPSLVGCSECYVSDDLHLALPGYARLVDVLRSLK